MSREMKRFMILTYGCQMNRHDTEKIVHQLETMGLEKTEDQEEAHLILLLTCSVREKAESKVFGKLGELKALKERDPHLLIGIGGCMTQQREMAHKIKRSYPHVDIIFGTHNLHVLKDLVEEALLKRSTVLDIWKEEKGIVSLPFIRERPYTSWISIIYGCNNFCTYCIVPYVRGRERSRPSKEIFREVQTLVTDGVREITLLGQNVNSYGKDREGELDFSTLLQSLSTIPGLDRIRFTTSHPRDFQSSIIDTIVSSKNICEHIHLPLQSGSTRILKKMNRGYTREEYLRIVEEIKERIEGTSITTDIMVGFPGEEEEDFSATLDVIERVRYDSSFTFLYSPRRNTKAADWEDTLPEEIKKERFQRLLHLQNRITLEENQRYAGETVEVLGEGRSKKDSSMQMGRTRTNKVVIFPQDQDLEGKMLMVQIERVATWNLFGRLVERLD